MIDLKQKCFLRIGQLVTFVSKECVDQHNSFQVVDVFELSRFNSSFCTFEGENFHLELW